MQLGQVPLAAPQTADRILAPDVARGMMLLCIAVANVSSYLWGREATDLSTTHLTGEDTVSTILSFLVMIFIDGHVYPMFAFLFGYGITQFAISRISRGAAPHTVSKMLLRRHLWLLAFGGVHALLLFAGDILGAYAFTGLAVSALLLRGSDRLLRILLWVAGALAACTVLFTAVSIAVLESFSSSELILAGDVAAFDMGIPGIGDVMSGIANYWLAMIARFAIWVTSSIGAVLSLIVPFLVVLGGLLARYRWLENVARTRFSLAQVAIVGITIGLLGSLPAGFTFLGIWQPAAVWSGLNLFLFQFCGVVGGLGYVALIAWLGSRAKPDLSLPVKAIAAVGKRSLSFYLLQSCVFAPLLSAWGLGLGASLSSAQAYLLAGVVWLCSLVLAVWLDARGWRGPAEVLLRRLTYGR
ncbi:MAG: DUF418 domain-containing protein [Leucobacter sp.]|nr:DUF418 domain-containing protein [Leucobacter sp.]